MATFQQREGRWRAIVRRKGHKAKSNTFATKSMAKVWADRVERELEELEARGQSLMDGATLADVIDWYKPAVSDIKTTTGMKALTATHKGNLTRLREGLGQKIATKLTAADVIEHARRRCQGEHTISKGVKIPACGPATMNVELSYLTDVLKTAQSMGKVTLLRDPVADARPFLRRMKLVAKSKKRDRRPTSDELTALHQHFAATAWRAKIPMSDIVEFAIATAKRESEITRLLRSDIDDEKRTAMVRDAKHPRSKEGNHRHFPLLDDAWAIVKRQSVVEGEDRLFPYNSKSVGTAFRRACKELRIADLHFHDLRHEATSRLFEKGYQIQEVAAVTLHESWTELKRYTQLRPESLHRN